MSAAYSGTELELFAAACNWKSYLGASLAPFIRGRVLDVGAGIGGNIRFLTTPSVTEWVALEPDPRLANAIGDGNGRCVVWNGTLDVVSVTERFDTVLYIDVLEHIASDREEVERAARLLAPGGRLVILVPAHQFLFSPFDAAIGHYRRYGLKQLQALKPRNFRTEVCRLMDSAGFFASLANRIMLRQAVPTRNQIAVWDRILVRASRIIDPIAGFRIGKSLLTVWRHELEA